MTQFYKLMRKDEQGTLVPILDTNGLVTLCAEQHLVSTQGWRESLEKSFGNDVRLTWERVD